MKLRLTAFLICALLLGTVFSSCNFLPLAPNSFESSSIVAIEEAQNSSDNTVTSNGIVDSNSSSEVEDIEDIKYDSSNLSQDESSSNQNISSKNDASSNKETSSKSDISSKKETSSKSDISSKNNTSVNQENSSKQNNNHQEEIHISSDIIPSSDKEVVSNISSQNSSQNTVAMPIRPIRPDQYYGWQYLKETGSEAAQKAYQFFVESFGKYEMKLKFDFNVTGQEAEIAFDCYKDDYPQHFWVKSASYRSKNGFVHEFILTQIPLKGDVGKIKECEKQMFEKSKQILSKVNGSMPVQERERIIHNSLISNTKFDVALNTENSHNMYGALVDGVAVCEGYSNAFQYLMRQAGVQCILVKGDYNDDKHEWNMVKIGANYYHVDVTADDPIVNGGKIETLKFDYFNLSQQDIEKDHIIKDNVYTIPEANSSEYTFFRYYGLETEDISVDFVAKSMAFSANNGYEYAHMKFNGISTSDAVKYIAENYNEILSKANQSITGKKLVSGQNIDYSHDAAKGILSVKLKFE